MVENDIALELPEKIGIMFDGWSVFKTHFTAIFATYKKKGKYVEALLAFLLLLRQNYLGALHNIAFMKATLRLYGKSLDHVVVWIGDNCSVNRKTENSVSLV